MESADRSLVPSGDPDSVAYWEHIIDGVLKIPHCRDCDSWSFFPRIMCPRCGSRDVFLDNSTGRGVVYSYTIVHRTASPYWKEKIPYAVALIDLAEGARLMADLRMPLEKVEVGVEVEFVLDTDQHDGLPGFRLV